MKRRVVNYTGVDTFFERVAQTTKYKDISDVKEGDNIYITDLGRSDYRTIQKIKEKIGSNCFELESGLSIQFHNHFTEEGVFFEKFEHYLPDSLLDKARRMKVLLELDNDQDGLDFI